MRSTTDRDGTEVTVVFAERFARSETFHDLFGEGIGLVEETAAYLDGPGRTEAKTLTRTAALAYASESMRLTTRLMQLASWLLLQRAVREGELTQDQANSERRRVRLDAVDAQAPVRNDLPEGLASLIRRSLRLHERVRHLETALADPRPPAGAVNPVGQALGRLAAALKE